MIEAIEQAIEERDYYMLEECWAEINKKSLITSKDLDLKEKIEAAMDKLEAELEEEGC